MAKLTPPPRWSHTRPAGLLLLLRNGCSSISSISSRSNATIRTNHPLTPTARSTPRLRTLTSQSTGTQPPPLPPQPSQNIAADPATFLGTLRRARSAASASAALLRAHRRTVAFVALWMVCGSVAIELRQKRRDRDEDAEVAAAKCRRVVREIEEVKRGLTKGREKVVDDDDVDDGLWNVQGSETGTGTGTKAKAPTALSSSSSSSWWWWRRGSPSNTTPPPRAAVQGEDKNAARDVAEPAYTSNAIF